MKLSAKTEYACIAMLQLAKKYDNGEPLLIRRIAEEHGISARFLVQILLQLNRASLVASKRGTFGGYRLARKPSKITLVDVVDAMEGHKRPVAHAGKKTPLVRSLLRFCRELEEMQRERLGKITLAHLVEQAGLSHSELLGQGCFLRGETSALKLKVVPLNNWNRTRTLFVF